jgi:hypothetical protein
MKHSGAAGFPVIGQVKPFADEVTGGYRQEPGLAPRHDLFYRQEREAKNSCRKESKKLKSLNS